MRLHRKCKCQMLEIVRPILPVPRSTRFEVTVVPSERPENLPRRRKCRRSYSRVAREHGVAELEFMSKRSILLPYNFCISRKPPPTVPPVTPNSEFSFECKFENLPKKFPDLKCLEIPIIRDSGIKLSIELLGEFFNCTDYQFSFLQYWFLDFMVDCIWRSQDDFGFSVEEQRNVLTWILFFLDLIRDPRNYSREEFFGIFRETIDIAVDLIAEGDFTMYHPMKLMDISPNERSINTDVISERYSTPSAIITPRTSKSKESENLPKKCGHHHSFDSYSDEDCMCFEKLCQHSLRPSSDEQESQYIPKVLPSKPEDENESSSESYTSSIHGESEPDYDFLDYLNSCDPYPENLESLYSDLHFEFDDLQRYKILPLKYGRDIPAFILFSPSLVSSSEDSNQPSTIKESSTTDSKTTTIPTTKSDESVPVMKRLTMYKVMEQRVHDYMDSNVGLSSWQIKSLETVQDNLDPFENDEKYYGEGEEEQSSIHSQHLEVLQDKQFVNFGMLWMVIDFIHE